MPKRRQSASRERNIYISVMMKQELTNIQAAIPEGDSLASKCQHGLIENYHRWIFGLISLGVPTNDFDFYGR